MHHARTGRDIKRRGIAATALGAAMRGVGWAYEENRHEATEVQAQAPDEDLADDGELLNRISFGDKDPLW